MKLEEMAVIIGQAALAFPNVSVSAESIRSWYGFFENTNAEKFRIAMIAAVKEPGRKFFPSPGEVNAQIVALDVVDPRTVDEFWCEILALCRTSTGDEAIGEIIAQKSSAAAMALQSIGGARRVRYADIDKDLPFIRRDFVSAFTNKETQKAEQTNVTQARELIGKFFPNSVKGFLAGGRNE